MGDTEQPCELALEMKQSTLCGCFFFEMGEGAGEEVVEFGGRMIVLGGEFKEFYKVGCKCEPGVVATDAVAGMAEARFTEGMEFAFCAARKGDFAIEEKIQHTCEGALWAECAFGDGFDFSVFESKPGDDEARITESRFAEEDGAGVFQILWDTE
jgi:hypothetical protein